MRTETVYERMWPEDIDAIIQDLRAKLVGWGAFDIWAKNPIIAGSVYRNESLIPKDGINPGFFDSTRISDGHTQPRVAGISFRTTFAVFTLIPGATVTYTDDGIEIGMAGGLQTTWCFKKHVEGDAK